MLGKLEVVLYMYLKVLCRCDGANWGRLGDGVERHIMVAGFVID